MKWSLIFVFQKLTDVIICCSQFIKKGNSRNTWAPPSSCTMFDLLLLESKAYTVTKSVSPHLLSMFTLVNKKAALEFSKLKGLGKLHPLYHWELVLFSHTGLYLSASLQLHCSQSKNHVGNADYQKMQDWVNALIPAYPSCAGTVNTALTDIWWLRLGYKTDTV